MYAQKRSRQDTATLGKVTPDNVKRSHGTGDSEDITMIGAGGNTPGSNGIVDLATIAPLTTTPTGTQLPNSKRKPRKSARRSPIHLTSKDVWERLRQLDVGLSMADWIALSKTAAKDVQDGIRFMHGRMPAKKKKTCPKSAYTVYGSSR